MSSVEDCIAMSEDGDWFAYPKTMSRGQAMSAVARSAEDVGYYAWHETLTRFRVRAGFVRQDDEQEPGWWSECSAFASGATPAWIVSARP